jgi:PAS domain S-box-containing protein
MDRAFRQYFGKSAFGQALLHNFVENAAVPTFLTKADGDVFYANQAFCDLLEYAPNEIIGLGIDRIVHPDDAVQTRKQTAALATGEFKHYKAERRYFSKNGKPIWVLVSASPLMDKHTGQLLSITVQAVDIDRQKQAELALAESESRWNFALESGGQGVWDRDLRNKRMFYSKMWRVMRGIDPSEEIDPSEDVWLQRVHPEDRARVQKTVRQQDMGEISMNAYEYRERHRDGHYMWIMSRGRAVEWFPDGRPARYIGTDTDITSLKNTQESLNNISAFHNLVIENIPAMVFVKNAKDHRFMLVNRAAEQLLGIDRSELLGKNDFDFFPKEQAETFISRDKVVFESGELQVTPEESINSRHNGIRILHTTKIPVFDEQGQPQYLVALCQDITDRKTAEIQLRQAQKMEAIGNLTGGVAHDFNNLLGIIIGNLDHLRSTLGESTKIDPLVDQLASEALNAGLRGADLVKRLLSFARRQPLRSQHINVNELIDGIIKLLKRTLPADIEIKLNLGAGVWPVNADPSQLGASLINIANNARDAMPNGGVLTVATSNQELDADLAAKHIDLLPGNYTMIEISDTGAGIPPEILSQIFEPFFTTKEQGKGTGLGLSMVFGFVKQSAGHIDVYSEAGHGTTFRLYLPRDSRIGDTPEAATPSEPGSHETVLTVEDNDGMRRVAMRQLKELGYRVVEAQDGPSALKILESQPIDLLFSDIMMPGGMSGYDLAAKAIAHRPALKVLLTSGFADTNLNGSNPAIRTQLLAKPYRKDDLARALREVLDAN